MVGLVTAPMVPRTTALTRRGATLDHHSAHVKAREQVPWSWEIWEGIDRQVRDSMAKVRVAAKFLPQRRVHPSTTHIAKDVVQSQIFRVDHDAKETLTINEYEMLGLNEIWTEFALTPEQVEEAAQAYELADTSAMTLATRAGQYLALAQDLVIFQGPKAAQTPFFRHYIHYRKGGLFGSGLLQGRLTEDVNPIKGTDPPQYGLHTFKKVVKARSRLAALGHAGDYALVLHTEPYADLFAPVNDVIITADRVLPLLGAGLFGTQTLDEEFDEEVPSSLRASPPNSLPASPPSSPPASPPSSPPGPPPSAATPRPGVLVSTGGNTMDLVVGQPPTIAFIQQDFHGNYRFRIFERFVFRLKDPLAVIVLLFRRPDGAHAP